MLSELTLHQLTSYGEIPQFLECDLFILLSIEAVQTLFPMKYTIGLHVWDPQPVTNLIMPSAST